MGFKKKGHTEFLKAGHIVGYKKGQLLRTSGRRVTTEIREAAGRKLGGAFEAELAQILCE
ncbi:hypothetical protein SLEP1_g6472 [Rubroshorea leprosula]|uniref:Uncharacterized protein n=1 Tax=Rubroshorea leprosula TaxID=152421 RepID=A0AAV5I1B5_9ROSI|nr:hypothetical protein SLEP1_g6472 [Rubroshorea leprosula]